MSLGRLEPERALQDADCRPQPAVLSPSQEASLLFQELAVRSGAVRYGNDFAQVFRARRHLDVALLEECLRLIVSRHSSLRTAFRPSAAVAGRFREIDLLMFSRSRLFVPGLYTGIIYDADSVGVPLSHVSSFHAPFQADQTQSLRDLIWQESLQRLPLDTPPALRACLIDTGSAEQTLLLVMSHLVFDAWSIRLFLSELTTLYMGGVPASLPPVTSQYEHFARDQRRQLAGGALTTDLAYWVSEWKRADRGTIPHRELPLAMTATSPARQNSIDDRRLSPFETECIRAALKMAHITPYLFFRAALTIVLHHYTARRRIGLWTNLANRRDPRFANTIGCFAHHHFIAVEIAPADTCDDLYRRTSAVIATAQAHEAVPRIAVAQRVAAEEDDSARITFDVLPRLAAHQLTVVEPVRMATGGFEWVDLAIRVSDEEPGFILVTRYASGRYSSAGVAQLLQHLAEVALAMATSAQLTVTDCISRMTAAPAIGEAMT
jgi:hypothetical protein